MKVKNPFRQRDKQLPLTVSPFTLLVDTREQVPYQFRDCGMVVKQRREGLRTGDYSLEGYESHVCAERKSLQDLYGTLGQGRERFSREIERMAAMNISVIVVEASWRQTLEEPPTMLAPASVAGTVHAWTVRYPRVHWMFAGDRAAGERFTLEFLSRFWKEVTEGNSRG